MKHNLNPIMNAQLDRNRRTRTHRRNLSDPRFSTSLTDSLNDEEVSVLNKIMQTSLLLSLRLKKEDWLKACMVK